jgi:hypothetical protein
MSIESVVGWDSKRSQVLAKGKSGDFYFGTNPKLAQAADEQPRAFAKRCCVHALLNHRRWTWTRIEIDWSALLFEHEAREKSLQYCGF